MTVAFRVIPKLDIKGPNLVKGVHLEGLRVLVKPEDFARYYYSQGADELIFQDVVASLYGRNSLTEIISKTAKEIFIPLTVGGGIKTVGDISTILRSGADKVSINTAAVQNSKVVEDSSRKFGSQCIVVAIDAKRKDDGWEIFTHGGRNPTGINALEFASKMEKCGAGELLVTSMDKDGTQSGYDIELMQKISSMVNIPVIASGGVGTLDHLVDGIKSGASAVLAASIFHYGTYSVNEAKQYLASKDIPVRI